MRLFFCPDEETKKEFVEETISILETARKFRNAESHPNAQNLTEYRDVNKINAFANEIAEWRKKYKDIFEWENEDKG